MIVCYLTYIRQIKTAKYYTYVKIFAKLLFFFELCKLFYLPHFPCFAISACHNEDISVVAVVWKTTHPVGCNWVSCCVVFFNSCVAWCRIVERGLPLKQYFATLAADHDVEALLEVVEVESVGNHWT